MSDQEKQKLIMLRKNQMNSLSVMLEGLREETNNLKRDNETLSIARNKLQTE